MKKQNGATVFFLIFAIIIIVLIAGVTIYLINRKVDDVNKVEEEYVKTEIAEAFEKEIHNKLLEAYKQIEGTQNDISTTFNENILIAYLDNKSDNIESPGIDYIDVNESIEKVLNVSEDGEVYKKYVIKPESISNDISEYGNGSIEDGDVFTLEPILITKEDGTVKSTGRYEIKYYDSDNIVTVLESVELYLTKTS